MQLHNQKKFRSEGKPMGEHAFIHNRLKERHTQMVKAENVSQYSKSDMYYGKEKNGKNAQVGGYSSLAKEVLESSAVHNNIHGFSIDTSQSTELFDEEERPKKQPKCSNQEPYLVGSHIPSDDNAKGIEAWPLEHVQAGTGAWTEFSTSMPKVGCNKFTSCTAPEDGKANMWSGAWNTTNNENLHGSLSQDHISSTIPCKDVWNKPTIWVQEEDENARREAGGWPKWETLSNKNSEQYSINAGTYLSTKPWTSLQDGKTKGSDSWGKASPQVNYINGEADGLDMTHNQSDADGWKQPNLNSSMSPVDCERKSRSSSTLLDGNAEKIIGESSVDDVHQKYVNGVRQTSFISSVMHRGGQNKSKFWTLTGNTKRETVGWPRWETAVNVSSKQCCNSSKGWAALDYGSMRKTGEVSKFAHKYGNGNKEIAELDVTESQSYHDRRRHHHCSYTMLTKRGQNELEAGEAVHAFDHNGLDGWRQSSPGICMVDKGSSCKSAFWDMKKFSDRKRETKGWPRNVVAVSKTSLQCPNSQNRKGNWNETQGWTASENRDSLKENDGRNSDLDRCGDPCMQQSTKGTLSKSACWDTTEVGKQKETSRWSKWGSTGSNMTETKRQYTSNQNRKGCSNQSQGCIAPKDVDSLKKNFCMNLDIIQSGSDNRSLIMSAGWDIPEAGNEKKETGGWPKWGASMSVTSVQYPHIQKRQGGWNKFQGRNESEDSDLQKEIGSMNPDLVKSGNPWRHPSNKGSLSKIAGWEKAEDCDGKGETGGWPKWDAALSATNAQCPSSQRREDGWSKSQGWTTSQDVDSREGNNGRISDLDHSGIPEDGDLRKEMDDRNPDIDQGGGDQWMQNSNKGSLSKCAGWEKPEDCNGKREAGGWPKWDAAVSETEMQSPSNQMRKGSWNQSQGWTTSQDGDSQKGNGGRNSDFDQTGDPKDSYLQKEIGGGNPGLDQNGDTWMQHSKKGSLSKSAGWDKPEGCNGKREAGGWPKWDAAPSVIYAQCPSSEKRKGGWNQSQGWTTSQDDDSRRGIVARNTDRVQSGDPWMQHGPMALPRCEWSKSASWTAEFGDSVRGDCRKKGYGSDQIGGDSRKRLNPTVSSKVCCRKSGSLSVAQVRGSIREKSEWSASSGFVNCDPFKQHRNALSPRVGWERPYRSRKKIPSPVWKRDNYRSNERHVIGALGVAEPYKYSPTGRGQRDGQFQQYSDRDLEEFRESKKARYLGHDMRRRFDDPWKQRDHLRNGFTACKTTMIYPQTQTHPMRVDECFRGETINSIVRASECSADQDVHKSTHDWKNQQNSNICHQGHQKHDSPSEIQNDYTINQNIQLKQNMQFNSQVPSSSTLNQSHQLILQHGSYPNDEVQNNRHQAMSKGESFRRNGNIYDTSLIQELNVTETKVLQNSRSLNACHSEPVVVQDNGEKNIVNEVEKGNGAWMGMVGTDDGILMFKCALADFVKEIIKPIWKEGRLSKEAHKIVVKKVVEKVVGVLGTNIPQTKERIDQYMSYSEEKLKKLTEDYLKVFINS